MLTKVQYIAINLNIFTVDIVPVTFSQIMQTTSWHKLQLVTETTDKMNYGKWMTNSNLAFARF